MYRSVFEQGDQNTDAKLIADIIDHALLNHNMQLDMVVHFMNAGCFMMVFLGKGHNASWNINWAVNNPYILDTGVGILQLADPDFEAELASHIVKISLVMSQVCGCQDCHSAAEPPPLS